MKIAQLKTLGDSEQTVDNSDTKAIETEFTQQDDVRFNAVIIL
ncbi:MAG: hypothetical protein WA364_07385 [Candidatus Nitrosopolaris sp.]